MIYLPKIYGTCKGASRSVDLSMDLAKKTKDVYMYKEILHNKDVIDYLLSSGVKYTEDIKDVKAGNTVIIRAHGETKELFEYLDKNKIKYLDTTCTNVIKIHNIIEKYYNDGYSIIIIGKNNHPEVIGSNGWCGNSAYICESVKDIDAIKKVNDNILVICQTTISDEMFNSITTALKEKFNDVGESENSDKQGIYFLTQTGRRRENLCVLSAADKGGIHQPRDEGSEEHLLRWLTEIHAVFLCPARRGVGGRIERHRGDD